jgi:hypothetical protein
MKKLLIAGLALAAIATPASARTVPNTLFTCSGVLERYNGADNRPYYEIYDRLSNDDYPMSCMIDDKVFKQILKVCKVGKACVVSAKGETGNGGSHLIEKVFAVQPDPTLDDALKEKQKGN